MAKCLVRNVIGFQYKICYSKIKDVILLLKNHTYFNTKFVIAKCLKIIEKRIDTIFQYKICYSKIQSLKQKMKPFKNFNTKFVIAK